MPEFFKSISLNYKDVNLIAQPTKVNSRKEIPIEGYRIVVSAMTSIVGPSFIRACAQLPMDLRPTIHLPRDKYVEENIKVLEECNYPKELVFIGIGLNGDKSPHFSDAWRRGYRQYLIDIANGYLQRLLHTVRLLKSKYEGISLVAGSVHTEIGYNNLANAGIDMVRSGIAPGSVCITKDSTGFTRGTITEIISLHEAKGAYLTGNESAPNVLADGGIKSPSDINKALLAGANYIMSGRIFVECQEARMHVDDDMMDDWFPAHTYFGMASDYGKMAMGGSPTKNIEGRAEYIDPSNLQSLESILSTIWDGIRSGISYSGYGSVTNAIGNGCFEITKM